MPLSNLQTLVNEAIEAIGADPVKFIQAKVTDKKALAMLNLVNMLPKKMFDINVFIPQLIEGISNKTPEQWASFERLLVGVIEGDEQALQVVREFIRGVVEV